MHKTVTNNLIYELKFIAIFFVKKLDIGKIRDIRKKKQNKFKVSQFKVKKVTQLYANKVKSTSNNEANGFFFLFLLKLSEKGRFSFTSRVRSLKNTPF